MQQFLVLLAFASSLFFNGLGDKPSLLIIITACCTTALAMSIHQAWSTEGRLATWNLASAAFVVFLLLCINTSVGSVWPQASLQSIWILSPLSFSALLLIWHPKAREIWPRIFELVQLAAIPYAAFGLYEFLWLGNEYPNAAFMDTNVFAGLCNFFFFLTLTQIAASEPGKRNWASYIALFIFCFAMFSTKSRGAMLSWAGGMSCLLLVAWPLIKTRKLEAKSALATGIVAISATLGVQLSSNPVDNWNVMEGERIDPRILLYKSAVEMIQENPIQGSGLGTFKALYPLYRDYRETPTSGNLVHNDYLQLAVEGGLPLLACMLIIGLLLCITILQCMKKIRSESDISDQKLRLLGIQIGALALLAHANVNFILYVTTLNMLVGLSVGASVSEYLTKKRYLSLTDKIRPPTRKLLFVFFLSATLWYPTIDWLIYRALGNGNPTQVEKGFLTAERKITIANFFAAIRPGHVTTEEFLSHTYAVLAEDSELEVDKRRFIQLSYESYLRQMEQLHVNAYAAYKLARMIQNSNDMLERKENYSIKQLAEMATGYRPFEPFGYLLLAEHYEESEDPVSALEAIKDSFHYFGWHTMRDEHRIILLKKAIDLANKSGKEEEAEDYRKALSTLTPKPKQLESDKNSLVS